MASNKYNTRNPAVKRILQEMKELQREPSSDYMAAAIEDNIFEWHFAVRGPQDTEFQGGIYHGRILLPPEYPFKPPSFLMLTPNGRFETNAKICLSISSHHPEHWQPSWSVRTALTALIAFFPTPGNGAIGSLDFTKEERAVLAGKARVQAPVFGSPERQAVTDEVHAEMLKREAQEAPPDAAQEVAQLASQPRQQSPGDNVRRSPAGSDVPQGLEQSLQEQSGLPASDAQSRSAQSGSAMAGRGDPKQHAQQPAAQMTQASEGAPQGGPAAVHAQHVALPQHASGAQQQQAQTLLGEVDNAVGAIAAPAQGFHSWEDTGLTMLAGVLVMLIAAILFRRILIISGVDVTSLM